MEYLKVQAFVTDPEIKNIYDVTHTLKQQMKDHSEQSNKLAALFKSQHF